MNSGLNVQWLQDLPEAGDTSELAFVVKRYKYIGVVLKPRSEPGRITSAFFLHQVEARKLGEALLAAASVPVRDDFAVETLSSVEGVGIGGPPRREQLVEFNPSLLRRARRDECGK